MVFLLPIKTSGTKERVKTFFTVQLADLEEIRHAVEGSKNQEEAEQAYSEYNEASNKLYIVEGVTRQWGLETAFNGRFGHWHQNPTAPEEENLFAAKS